MATTETRPYDAAQYLKTDEECALYLDAVTQECPENEKLIAAALGDIARAA
jgi:DNA-binding phage protein